MLDLEDVDDRAFSCIARNTQINRLSSIIKNGLALGGDGITQAVHSQLSAFRVSGGQSLARKQSSWLDECHHPLQLGADQDSFEYNIERGARNTQTHPALLH